jgi:hypothetical protein
MRMYSVPHDEVRQRYLKGENSVALGRAFGIPASMVCYILKRAGVGRREASDAGRRLPLDQDAFSVITTDSAYWAGFLMADGAVVHNALTVTLAQKDAAHVCALRTFLGSGHKIMETRNSGYGGHEAVRLHVKSKRLVGDLATLGVGPRKSMTAVAPETLVGNRHFWRGVIDGDGHVGIDRRRDHARLGLVGSLPLLEQFRGFVCGLTQTKALVRPHKGIYRFEVSGVAATHILHHLYHDAAPALRRKAALAIALSQRRGAE